MNLLALVCQIPHHEPPPRKRYNPAMSAEWKQLWSDLSNMIDDALPGSPIWSQSIPIENGDVSEGLAIRHATQPDRGYYLVYFRLLPTAVDQTGEMLGGQDAHDWWVDVTSVQHMDTIEKARDEARKLLNDLPTPDHLEDRGYDFFLNLLDNETIAELS